MNARDTAVATTEAITMGGERLGGKVPQEHLKGEEDPSDRSVEHRRDRSRGPAPDQAAHPFSRYPEKPPDPRPHCRPEHGPRSEPSGGTPGPDRHDGGGRTKRHRPEAEDPSAERNGFHGVGDTDAFRLGREKMEKGGDQQSSKGGQQKNQVGPRARGGKDRPEEEALRKPYQMQEGRRAQGRERPDRARKKDVEGLVPDAEGAYGPEDPASDEFRRCGKGGIEAFAHAESDSSCKRYYWL
jgi:hypothetical protein